jgi:PKD repeat protein
MKKLLLIFLLLLMLVSSVSADILLVNPTSDTEIYKTGVNQTFSTLRGAATGTGAVTTLQFVSIVGDNQVNNYSAFYRFGASYDTSPIGTGTVNSVKFGWKNLAKDNKQGNLGINVTTFIPASFTMVNAGANYNKFGSTSLANWNYADVVTSASTYNNASLIGLTINKTGYTALGMLVSADLSGNEGELTWLVGKGNSGFRPYTKAYAATGTFLEIDYTGDTTPPDSITELTNTTATNCSSINWTWTNPTDADFNHTYVLKNNVWYDNLSNTTTYSLWTGLTESTLYEIATHTVDLTGNMNTTWVNASYTLPACGIAPVASFTSDQTSGTEPLPVLLTDTSTNTPTAWNYSFNNVTGNNTVVWFSTAQNPVITLGVGNFSFALNASNAYGYNLSTQITWVNVSVIPTPPVAAFTPTGVVTGITSVTQAFADTSTNSSTAWEYGFLNSTGNNSWTGFATTQNPTYTFGIGNFSINLTASNTFGSNTSTQSTWINVSYVPTPPVADFNATPVFGLHPTVIFTDNSTNTPTSWLWDFGDGDATNNTAQNPVHHYLTNGTYNVSLRATNEGGSDWENKTKYVYSYGLQHPIFVNATTNPYLLNVGDPYYETNKARMIAQANVFVTKKFVQRGDTSAESQYCLAASTVCNSSTTYRTPATFLAEAYYFTGNVSYSNKAMEILFNMTGGDCDVSALAGTYYAYTTDISLIPGNTALAYDLIHPSYGIAGSNLDAINNTALRLILAENADVCYRAAGSWEYPFSLTYNIPIVYVMFTSPVGEVLADEGFNSTMFNTPTLYNNRPNSTPANWSRTGDEFLYVDDKLKDYTQVAAYTGKSGAMIQISNPVSGANTEGEYTNNHYNILGRWVWMWSNAHNQNMLDVYPQAKAYAISNAWQDTPIGYSDSTSAGRWGRNFWMPMYSQFLDANNKSVAKWAMNRLSNTPPYTPVYLRLPGGQYIESHSVIADVTDGTTNRYVENNLFWLSNLSSVVAAPPSYTSALWRNGSFSVFRSGWGGNETWLEARAEPDPRTVASNRFYGRMIDQLAFSYATKGDQQMGDSGEVLQGCGVTCDFGVTGVDHNGFLFSNGTVPFPTGQIRDGSTPYLGVSIGTSGTATIKSTDHRVLRSNLIQIPSMEYQDFAIDNVSLGNYTTYTQYTNTPIDVSRGYLFPMKDYIAVIDRVKAGREIGIYNNFKFTSLDAQKNTSTQTVMAAQTPFNFYGGATMNGTLNVNGVPVDYRGRNISEELDLGMTTNNITWTTENIYGNRSVTLNLFTAPASNVSELNGVSRMSGSTALGSAGYEAMISPGVILKPADTSNMYRVTALLDRYTADTPRTPSELTVTGTGSAIKVISASGIYTDTIYTGSGVSTFNGLTTNADTLFIRGVGQCAFDYTLINGNYINYGTPYVYFSSVLMDYVSYNRTGGIHTVNISSADIALQDFYGVSPSPTYVRVDGVDIAITYDAINDILTVPTDPGEHSIEFDDNAGVNCLIPLQITNLTGVQSSCSSINWSWIDPVDPNYAAIDAYNNNTFYATYLNGTGFVNWTNLPEITNITFSALARDGSGVPVYNTTWVNATVMSGACGIAPNASFTYAPNSGLTSANVQFTDTSENVPTGWGWFFQNVTGNNSIVQFSTLQNPLYAFNFGNYTIRLNATNLYGSNVTTENRWVNVSKNLPIASFTSNVTSVCIGDYVQFNDTSINATTWFWLFGSGGVDSHDQDPVTNTFDTYGGWDVRLRATNVEGDDWENKTGYITVKNCTPPPQVSGCLAQTGLIPIWLGKSTSSTITWEWSTSEILTKLVLDGLVLSADIDNTTPTLMQSGFDGSTWHTLKIYNATDYGRLTCLTNASSTISSASTPINGVIPIAALLVAVLFLCRKKEES